MPIEELIQSYGYVCEQYEYETEDGYQNTVHRIPGPKDATEGAE
jgi:hypothetical protein